MTPETVRFANKNNNWRVFSRQPTFSQQGTIRYVGDLATKSNPFSSVCFLGWGFHTNIGHVLLQMQIQIHKHRNTQTQKYTNTNIHKYRNAQIHKQKCTNTEIHKYTNTEIHEYRNTQTPKHTNTEIHKSKNTQMINTRVDDGIVRGLKVAKGGRPARAYASMTAAYPTTFSTATFSSPAGMAAFPLGPALSGHGPQGDNTKNVLTLLNLKAGVHFWCVAF